MGLWSFVFGPRVITPVDVGTANVTVTFDDDRVRHVELWGGYQRCYSEDTGGEHKEAVFAKEVFRRWLMDLARVGFFELDDDVFVPISRIKSIVVAYSSHVQNID